jgi:metal iron transporter
LQSLCIKLGSVTGLNLAEACRVFLPKWLNITLYIMAEAAVRSCAAFLYFRH